MFTKFHTFIFTMLVVVFASCNDYDKWTVDPNARLVFSEDTVVFDTIITNQSSPTRQLLVWNNNKDGVRVSRVQLTKADESRFRVNVDGQYLYGGVGEDFEVRAKDSIFVKVEVMLPENSVEPNPHYEDDLTFMLESGLTQSVHLVADGLDVYILKGKTLTADTTFTSERPLWIRDSLVISEGVTLTIQPGTKLMFHDGVDFVVRGSLKAKGTVEQPIVFRGDRLDHLFPYLPYDNTTNRWGGIHFTETSTNNLMEQCDIHSGTYGIRCDSTLNMDFDKPILKLYNSVVHNVGGHGLDLFNTNVDVIGCQISNTFGHTVRQIGGACLFVHCTIAQFYPFSADRGDALFLTNRMGEDDVYPFYMSYFINTVITGMGEDVINGDMAEVSEQEPLPYLFRNCLLRTVVSEDEARFVNIIYDDSETLDPSSSKHFVLYDDTNFLYDFAPVEASAIRGKADVDFTNRFSPVDRRGTNRLQEGGPDIGAYQYVPVKN